MSSGLRSKMMNPEILLLVTCISLSTAIRVDFGTNPGPIVPAIPTTTKRPQPPFRNPAPVWEDQSGDIPNPNPYQYVLPPPSRPKPLTNNFKQSSRPISNQQTGREIVFGNVISPNDVNSWSTVSSLSPQYIPNYGIKYHAVVPANAKTYYTKNSDTYYNDKFNKFNGKYNIKTKKYKAYEKVKYVPQVYYSNIIDLPALSFEQELPLMQAPQPFRLPEIVHQTPTATYRVSKPKVAYTKDDLNAISKNYKTHQTHKQNSLSHDSKKTRR